MRLLVVEDQPKVAQFILKGFKEVGYQAELATDGETGLRLAQGGDYDLLILDLMLPGINGFTLLEKLRRVGKLTPVIILTARDALEDRIHGLDAGADDYLVKPFSFGELLARSRAVLRRGKESSDAIFRVADLEFDPVAHEVRRKGQKIPLTAREFALLEHLLRHQGRILTRTAILEKVWDVHFDTESNVVDAFVRLLRKKIDEGHPVKLIQTVRGIGYTLRPEE